MPNSLSIAVIEPAKEVGVLWAMEACTWTNRGIVFTLGVLSQLAAVPILFLVSPLPAQAMGKAMFGASVDYQYNWQAIGWWLVLVSCLSAVVSITLASIAARIHIRDSLTYA